MNRIITIGLALLVSACAATDYSAISDEPRQPTRYQTLNYNTGELEYWNRRGNRLYNYSTGEFGSIRAR